MSPSQPNSTSPAEMHSERSADFKKNNITLVPVEKNLVDLVWQSKMSQAKPADTLFIHDERWHGYSAQQKLEEIGTDLYTSLADGIIYTKLDEIACEYNFLQRDGTGALTSISAIPQTHNYSIFGQKMAPKIK